MIGSTHVMWPTYEDWSEQLDLLARKSDHSKDLKPEPGLYEEIVSVANQVLSLPSHIDYDRPESVARIVVGWHGPLPAERARPSVVAGCATVSSILRDGKARRRSTVVLAAQLGATLKLLVETEFEDAALAAHLADLLKEAGFVAGPPFDEAWALVEPLVRDGLKRGFPGPEAYDAWLATHEPLP